MADSGLVVDGVSVGYGPVRALRDVSLYVPEGAVVAVLGNNGAGKSTLLRAISRTLGFQRGAVTAGTIRFCGRPWTGSPRTGSSPPESPKSRRAGGCSPE